MDVPQQMVVLVEDVDIRGKAHAVQNRPCGVRVQTRHDGSPRRRADGLSDVTVAKNHAARCEGIEVGGVYPMVTVTRHGVVALLITQYEHQVALFLHYNVSSTRDRFIRFEFGSVGVEPYNDQIG